MFYKAVHAKLMAYFMPCQNIKPMNNESNPQGSEDNLPPDLHTSQVDLSKPTVSQPPILPPSYDHDMLQRTWRFAFQGTGMEYFKIWITNLFLTIISFTMYAPWAKVRRLRYFYGNTYLNRRKFDFTGVPVRILIGRVIALSLYVGLTLLFNFYADFGKQVIELSTQYKFLPVLAALGILFVIAWIFRSSFRFMARNSKYENSRFYFSASMLRSYWVFFCCIAITIFSMGILYPIALLWFKRYQLNHLYVGQLKFELKAEVGDFFVAVLLPSLAFMGVMIAAIGLVAVTIFWGVSQEFVMVIAGALYLSGIFFLAPLIQGYLFKATWGNVDVGSSKMQTDLSPWKFAWIQMTNNFAILLSLGLLYAWAQVRIYRYKIESLSLVFYDDPAQLMNLVQQDYNAVGEEIADIFDLDISL